MALTPRQDEERAADWQPWMDNEQALLGCVLLSGALLPTLLGPPYEITPRDFLLPQSQAIYAALLRLHEKGRAIDQITLVNELGEMLDAVGGVSYLVALQSLAPTTTHIGHYADQLIEHSCMRAMEPVAEELRGSSDFRARLQTAQERISRAIDRLDRTKRRVRLETSTLKELMARHFEPPIWIIPEVLPEGATIVGGKAKMGKSYWALDLALAVASGGMAMGQIKVEQRDVLYLSLEDGDEILQQRVEQLLEGGVVPDGFHYACASPTMDHDGVAILEEWLDAHPTTRFVVIDTLKRVRAKSSGRRGNAYEEDYEAISPLADLAHARRISIVMLHHLTKAPAVDDPFDELSGSMGVQATPDTLMVLRGVRGQIDAVLHAIGRRLSEQLDLALRRDSDHGGWVVMGTADEFELRKERQAIVDCIVEMGEPMTPRDIAASLDKNPSTVRVLLRKMVRDKEIQPPTTKGLYKVDLDPKGVPVYGGLVPSANVNAKGKSASRIISLWRQDAKKPKDDDTEGVNSGVNLGVNAVYTEGAEGTEASETDDGEDTF